MNESVELFNQWYSGEELCDLDRDIMETFDPLFNPKAKDIPMADGIHEGRFVVTVTWVKE